MSTHELARILLSRPDMGVFSETVNKDIKASLNFEPGIVRSIGWIHDGKQRVFVRTDQFPSARDPRDVYLCDSLIP